MSLTRWGFAFPRTTWSARPATKDNIYEQAEKLVEEAAEISAEAHDGCPALGDLAEETMDLICASETMLRMCESAGVDLDVIFARVVEKNGQRGYWITEQVTTEEVPA